MCGVLTGALRSFVLWGNSGWVIPVVVVMVVVRNADLPRFFGRGSEH